MKAFLNTVFILIFLCFCQQIAAQTIVQTVITKDVQQDGSKLIINFSIPYDELAQKYNRNFTFDIESIIVNANQTQIEAITYSGDIANLPSGQAHRIIWDLSNDVRMLSDFKDVEINLSYTQRTLQIMEDINNEQAIDQQDSIKAAQKVEHRKYRRFKKPFNFALVASYGAADFSYIDVLVSDPTQRELNSFYSLGVQLDFRLDDYVGSYFQIEMNYFNGEKEVRDQELGPFEEQRLKLYARFKFGEIQIGGLGGYNISDNLQSERSKFSYGGMIGWENHPTSIFLVGLGAEVEFEPSFRDYAEIYWIKAFGRIGLRF